MEGWGGKRKYDHRGGHENDSPERRCFLANHPRKEHGGADDGKQSYEELEGYDKPVSSKTVQ